MWDVSDIMNYPQHRIIQTDDFIMKTRVLYSAFFLFIHYLLNNRIIYLHLLSPHLNYK